MLSLHPFPSAVLAGAVRFSSQISQTYMRLCYPSFCIYRLTFVIHSYSLQILWLVSQHAMSRRTVDTLTMHVTPCWWRFCLIFWIQPLDDHCGPVFTLLDPVAKAHNVRGIYVVIWLISLHNYNIVKVVLIHNTWVIKKNEMYTVEEHFILVSNVLVTHSNRRYKMPPNKSSRLPRWRCQIVLWGTRIGAWSLQCPINVVQPGGR